MVDEAKVPRARRLCIEQTRQLASLLDFVTRLPKTIRQIEPMLPCARVAPAARTTALRFSDGALAGL
jgi:hypothetical protein